MFFSAPRRKAILSLTAAAALAAGVTTAATSTATSADPASAPLKAAALPTGVPAFTTPSSVSTRGLPAPTLVHGTSTLISVDGSALPSSVDGSASGDGAAQKIGFTLGKNAVVGRFTSMDKTADYTAWTGTLDGYDNGTFQVVRSGSVYRASINSPETGTYAVTQAQGDQYWLTDVEEKDALDPNDAVVPDLPAWSPSEADDATYAAKKRKGKPKVTLLFAYTKNVKAVLGSKSAIKAVAGLITAQTNEALKSSGVKAKMKYRGVVKAKGKESGDLAKDLTRLFRVKDGKFDNVMKVKQKKHADLVHLLAYDPSDARLCGIGYLPQNANRTHPMLGSSAAYLDCVPTFTSTHEIGHNLGADHTVYPGITHYSSYKYAQGYVDIAHGFITPMAYFNICYDQGVDCSRILSYSNPKKTYAGLPSGAKQANNAKAIKKVIPKVANYNGYKGKRRR